ncbi:bleomycin hydrolase-like isoform X1 [Mya arenaria]|uniref:bleomycin hydrolase-like isoform X1 n=2 Tax=Mya arenaria TaxID=6604 RepID=UPI0022E6CE80|nr:bleomycin hydrolase-like isoform X1 [Mya arenaria]
MTSKTGVSQELLDRFQSQFEKSEKNILAQNVCTAHPLWDVLASRACKQATQHCFNHKVEKEGTPMTDQQHSGRCWIFACLNIMRIPFMKKYKLDSFEFSQTYVYFWDKVERAHYLLNVFVACARKGEAYDGRLVTHLLKNPSEDGGQWDMLTGLIEKYGIVPKVCFPEAWSAENSNRICRVLNNRLREGCWVLHKMVADSKSQADIDAEITKRMEEIYRIMCIVLGTPPREITFQYSPRKEKEEEGNEAGKSSCSEIGPISPRDFYHKLIKPDCFNLEDMVCLVNDPRPSSPYNRLYTVEYLGNMTGGPRVLYINQPVDVLKKLTIKSIVDCNEAVWFGTDVGKFFRSKEGCLDLNSLDFKLTLGVDTLQLNKADRLMYGESLMTHAMVFTGVNTKANGSADKWRVENSWGDKNGEKGYLMMTDDWFTEFVYEVVVNKKLIEDQSILDVLNQEPTVLPAWDPMGALAH